MKINAAGLLFYLAANVSVLSYHFVGVVVGSPESDVLILRLQQRERSTTHETKVARCYGVPQCQGAPAIVIA
jgi:hypothetical protein